MTRSEPSTEADTPASENAPAATPVTIESLIAQVDTAIGLAERESPSSLGPLLRLKADLSGVIKRPPAGNDEDEDEIVPRDATPRDLGRAVLAPVREFSAQLRDLLGVELVVKFPDEAVLRVKDPDLAKHVHAGAEPALTLESHLERGSSITEREPAAYAADGSIRVNGYVIEFTDRAVEGRSRPVSEWVITDATGAVRGRRLTSEEAIAFARALPAN